MREGEECDSCGTDDDLLFTCRYCQRQFCASHQFPHHACARFSRDGTTGDASADESESGGGEPTSAEATDPSPGVEAGTGTGTGTATDAELGQAFESRPDPGVELETETETGPASSFADEEPGTDTAEGSSRTRPGDVATPVRPMDSRSAVGAVDRQDPGSVSEWLRRQTYTTLALKVGVIAFLVNAAFYGGMALTLYDVLRVGI